MTAPAFPHDPYGAFFGQISRKPRIKTLDSLEKKAWDDVASVFEYQRTSQQERDEILSRWLAGEIGCYMPMATRRGLSPIAVISACMIDSEHSLFCPEGIPFTGRLIGMQTLIYCVDIIRQCVPTIRLAEDAARLLITKPEE